MSRVLPARQARVKLQESLLAPMPTLLVIDDDRAVHLLVERVFRNSDFTVVGAKNAKEGLEALGNAKPDVLLLDVMLPEISGIELAKEFRAHDPRLPVIVITALNDSDTAIEAMKLGAYDYLLKPLDVRQLEAQVQRALSTRRLMNDPVRFDEAGVQVDPDDEDKGDVLIGRSPKMLDVYKQIGRVAAQGVTVLIRGESGTGKEVVARAIYHHSKRVGECFMAVNCAALHDTLLESELFGHEKGAFTGADRRHIGRFEQCNGGTIFLDEVGDMSPATQSKVLRLLQEQKFERVGGHETIGVDVRMISATNRNLEQMIEDGEFRLDLYHRLNAFEIQLPPLREREGDLELLLEGLIRRFNKQLGKKITGISPEALKLLAAYHWPGNIRELESVIRRAILMGTGPAIVPESLPPEIAAGESPASPGTGDAAIDLAAFIDQKIRSESNKLYDDSVKFMESHLLRRVLQATGGNQSQAAKRLGITRGSLRNKIRDLGIHIEQVVADD